MKLIDKAAVVAEIERQILAIDNYPELTATQVAVSEGNKIVLIKLLYFLDTLEVKEVDLKREIEKEIETRWHGEYLFTEKFKESAKHFFELGLSTSNKIQKGE